MSDCSQNTDPLKLVREGTTQDGRAAAALRPEYAAVDERGIAHKLVFARAYAELLQYFDEADAAAGTWGELLEGDVSVLLAVPSIEDVDAYKAQLQAWFDYLNRSEHELEHAELKAQFGFLFGAVGSLALALDRLKKQLPHDVPLKALLRNLIRTQLAPALARLVAYHEAGGALALVGTAAPEMRVLGQPVRAFSAVLAEGLSKDWSDDAEWAGYVAGIAPDASVYGAPASVFVRINHCSTHTLFKSVFEQFLRVLSRVHSESKAAFESSLTEQNSHQPHVALFLAFLRLMEHARDATNGLTQRHLDFYYRTILGLKEKGALPGRVHLLAEPAKQVQSRAFPVGELFKAGKDELGKSAFFANESDFIANKAKVAALKTLYRHGAEEVADGSLHEGRLFAAPVANSDDGMGAELTTEDGSWHPYFNKIYDGGELSEIRMPLADIGFGIASHHLWLSGGQREIELDITVSGSTSTLDGIDFAADVAGWLTVADGWFETPLLKFAFSQPDRLLVSLEVDGSAPPVVPYSAKVHGGRFETSLPLLVLKLKQDTKRAYAYSMLKHVVVKSIRLDVSVGGLRSVAASNDFGPLDTSKPFQPFGVNPVEGSSLVVGSKEVFQKQLTGLTLHLGWRKPFSIYPLEAALPKVSIDLLEAGNWSDSGTAVSVSNEDFSLSSASLDEAVLDEADFASNEFYDTEARQGFVRLRLTDDFGQEDYQTALVAYLRKESDSNPGPKPPTGPTAASLTIAYEATCSVPLNTADAATFDARRAQFFHVTPFGSAERHPYLSGAADVRLLPEFEFRRGPDTLMSEAEFYIGIVGLAPPQNLSLLFQVADGTANPLVQKPEPHISWSYLRNNQWVEFSESQVRDSTGGLLTEGIVTFSVPRDATDDNSALDGAMHWIRAAVHSASEAVCRLRLVAAQALQAVFADRGNSTNFAASVLPAGTVSKLAMPDAKVKGISQPFPSFGGRGAERSDGFYTRVSERLRHKNRAINLWDYERLILEAFPGIYKVKCLNHTHYEPTESGSGMYRELAPGHVTIVTIPNLQRQHQRNPLKPYTSLGVLEQIRVFIAERSGCFATLHVRNPQFEEVRVRFSLRLSPGYDETYYSNLLKQSVTNFLSPWAVAGVGSPTFGGRIYKSVLINFVEEQPYVDYVTDFQVFHDIGGVAGTEDLDVVVGSRAVSVLVSCPASKHDISIIQPAQDAAPLERCCVSHE